MKFSVFFTLLVLALRQLIYPSIVNAQCTMVKDIAPGGGWGAPFYIVNINGTLYFQADATGAGDDMELWKSDGTSSGTMMVKDVRPDNTVSSNPLSLTNVNGTLFFTADDGINDIELYKSDGTSYGTILVKEIKLGNSSFPQSLTNVNDTLYFAADDGIHGYELWKSDGTSSGTVIVKDILPGAAGSSPQKLTNINDTLYFVADDGTHGVELWKSDGTSAGTIMVKDIKPGAGSSSPVGMVSYNNNFYFQADDGSTGVELWKSDGTSAGTILVKDIFAGASSSSAQQFINFNNALYFQAMDASGRELWKTDGTSAGTVLVKDIRAGGPSSSPNTFTPVNNSLFFWANDGISGIELWKTDGTTGGTVIVKDIRPGASGSGSYRLINGFGTLYFFATDAVNNFELWKSDGTTAGTTILCDINPAGSGIQSYSELISDGNGTLYFEADDGVNGLELWKTAICVPPIITSPTANISVCPGTSTIISAIGLAGGQYTWYPSTGLNTTTGFVVTANPQTTTTYTIVADACPSTGFDTITITVHPLPTLITTPSSVICIGDSIVLGAIGASSYTWYPSTGLNSSTGNTVKASPPFTITYSITGTDGSGCVNTFPVSISVNPLPSLYTSGNVSICLGSNVTLSASGNAGSYSWMPGTFLNSTSGGSVLVSPTAAGTYSYSVVATDLVTTCTSKNNMTVTVLPNPIVVASNDVGICPGISTNLSAMSNAGSVIWIPSNGLNNNTSYYVTATPTITTTYTVTGTDVYGCTSYDGVMITVSAVLLANAGNDVSICYGSTTILTASGGSTYSWSPTENLSSSVGINVIASPTITTTYTLNIIDLCPTVPDYVTVTVFSLPTIAVSSNVTICEGSVTTLIASGAVNYSWNPGATVNPNVGSSVSASPTTSTTYTVTGTDANGCSSYNTIVVGVDPFSLVDAGPDVTIVLGQAVTLSPTAVSGATYSWSPSDYLSCTNCQNPVANPPTTTMYVLTFNNGVCSSTDSVTVYVKCNDVFVPTAFSPNGDLFNDLLYVKSVCIKTLISFAIYDRWGEKVFETSDMTKGWDGTFLNKMLEPDVFVYLIKGTGTNDEEITKKGNVSLIK